MFPIPDADTGNNMAMAFRAFASSCAESKAAGLGCLGLCRGLGLTMLMNAQGNSGTISTYFFNKLVGALDAELKGVDSPQVEVVAFCRALEVAGKAVGSAMDNPKLGTMISVIQDSAADLASAAAASAGSGPVTVEAFLKTYQANAQASLLRTPDQLEVDGKFILKDAGIDFDSGAKGYVLLIDGMMASASGVATAMPARPPGQSAEVGDNIQVGHEEEEVTPGAELVIPTNRFCTEFLVELPSDTSVDEAGVRSSLTQFGDSIVPLMAPRPDGTKLLKTHIHSNEPQAVWDYASGLPGAKMVKTKADDMLMQVAPHFPPPTREALDNVSYRIVIYSTNALASTSIAARNEWGFVPARVTVGGESYKDHVEISAATVFNNQRNDPDFKMGTGGATVGDMYAGIKKELDKEPKLPVVFIPLAYALSGGTQVSVDGARQLMTEEERGRFKTFVPPGLWCHEAQATLKLHELALARVPYEEAEAIAQEFVMKSGALLCVPTAKYLVEGGRVPAAAIAKGDLCFTFRNLKETWDEKSADWGKLAPACAPCPAGQYEDQCAKVVDMAEAAIKASDTPDAPIRFFLNHTGAPHKTLATQKLLEERFNVKDITTLMFSPIAAVHTGPELFFLSWSFEEAVSSKE